MDLSDLKKQSDLSFEVATAKRNALERARSRQVVAYNGSIFSADADTINLVDTLKKTHKTFFILDSNENPCEITNPQEFLEILLKRNQEALNEYHQLYNQLKKRV